MVKDLTIDKVGRIRLPKEVRERFGNKVRIRLFTDGRLMLEPTHSIWELRGSVDPKGIHLSIEDMHRIVQEEAMQNARS
ncbi:MAG: hypothetical protein FJY65_12430 [Calditrichaeota bacterium]|nr:hypothetical protein [Calditrichota bacterium]